jgi:N-acetylglucosamine kinase-like BadF-type ATPase
MVLAVGTGMNAAVITPRGQEWAFGYYETFGGAGTFVRQAFEAVLRAEDGRGQPTLLTGLLLERLGFATVEAMLRAHVLRQIERSRMASVTPLVFDAALAGDEAAAGILVRQGQALAEYAAAMARRFAMQSLAFDVVLAGSVFKGAGSLLADTIAQEVRRTAPLARIVRARFEPAAGSLLLAFDALRIPVTEEMYARLAQSMPGPAFFDTSSGAGPAPTREETAVESEE